jgi:hypothetical protein
MTQLAKEEITSPRIMLRVSQAVNRFELMQCKLSQRLYRPLELFKFYHLIDNNTCRAMRTSEVSELFVT